MIIYVFRHAQKATDFSSNPDLTEAGHRQAQELLKKVTSKQLPIPDALWTSPKIRAQNTFIPLSHHLSLDLVKHEGLYEQSPDEDLSQFRQRVRKVLESAANSGKEVLFICSHYDWVVEAMNIIPADKDLSGDDFHHWSPCQHVGFRVLDDGLFEFIELKRISP